MELWEVARAFPAVNVKVDRLQRAFYNLGVDVDARRWFALALFAGLTAGIVAGALFGPYGGVVVGSAVMALLYLYPILEDRARQARIEAEMPIFLRDLGSLLNMDIPFVVALKILARREGVLARELAKVLREVEKGVAVPKALAAIGERVESNDVKRAIAQIMVAYEQGGGGEGLRRLAADLLNVQKFKLSEYASKSSLLGLAFIVFSVIGPTLYLVVAMLTPLLFGEEVDVEQVGVLILALPPLLSLGVVMAMKGLMPSTALRERVGVEVRLLALALLAGAVWLTGLGVGEKLLAFLALSLLLFLWEVGHYWRERALEEVEQELPNVLLAIAALPRGAKVEKILESAARTGRGLLREEFGKALRQVESGLSLSKVVEGLKESIPTEGFRRVADVLLYSLQSGHSVSERMAELAEDLFLFLEMKRKRAELMGMQKYTLMAGLLLMALVLAMAVSLVEDMAQLSHKAYNLESLKERYLPAYLIINAALVADFAAYVDGRRSRAYLYFALLSPLALGIFLLKGGVLHA